MVSVSHTQGQPLPDVRPAAQQERRPILDEREGAPEREEQAAESWPCRYGYGEFALDRLIGVARCEVATIAWITDSIPAPAIIRQIFDVTPHLSIEITNKPPRRVCTLDDVVLLENGELYDLGRSDAYEPQRLALRLTSYELTAEDILRLNRLIRGYPEILVSDVFAKFLRAGVDHLDSLRSQFPEVGSLFNQYRTITGWRAGDGQPASADAPEA